jgi:hypothetical protein
MTLLNSISPTLFPRLVIPGLTGNPGFYFLDSRLRGSDKSISLHHIG